MAYGIKILNDEGAVQIDDTYSNLLLQAKGTSTTSGSIGNIGCSYKDIVFTNCTAAVVGFRCTTHHMTALLVARSGTTWTFRFIIEPTPGVGGGSATSSTGTSFTYYLFDTDVEPSSDAYGMRIWKDDGQIAYDSGHMPMIPIDSRHVVYAGSTNLGEFTYDEGEYATIASRTGNDGIVMGGGPTSSFMIMYLFSAAKAIPNGVSLQYAGISFIIYDNPNNIPTTFQTTGDWIIIKSSHL